MNLSQLIADLSRDEGRVPHAYQDHLGFWTIGVGHLIDKRKGGGLPEKIIDDLLLHDIAEKSAQLDTALPWWRDMSDARQRALLNMAFQMGVEGLLKFKRTLAALQAGRWDGAKASAMDSLWAKQTQERAERVTNLFLE